MELTPSITNAVVEKHFSIPATTRNWNTITAIRGLLQVES